MHPAPLRLCPNLKDDAGQVLFLFLAALLGLCVITAMVVDVGMALREKAHLQTAADGAALAAAQDLPDDPDQAVKTAMAYIEAHGVDLDEAEVSIDPSYAGTSDAVSVDIKTEVNFLFGSIVDIDSATVPAHAVATVSLGSSVPASDASIIALNPTVCKSLEVNSGGAFKTQGPIMINSNCSNFAAEFGCGSSCKAEAGIESVGRVKKDEKCKPCNVSTIASFLDPLAGVLPPCFPSSPTPCEDIGVLPVRHGTAANPQLLTNSNFDFQPGIYYGGIAVGGNVKPWAAGVYVIAGGGLKINTSTSFRAEGVMIYNTNDPSCPNCSLGKYGKIEINTSSDATVTPPVSGPYEGLLFFQDRNNTEKAVYNPSASFGEGTIYIPSAHVDFNPSANARVQIIADTIKMNPSASFTAAFDGDFFYSIDEGGAVRLVE